MNNAHDKWKKFYAWNPFASGETVPKQKCLFDEYVKRNPDEALKPVWLSCPCPKCNVSF